MPELDVVNCSWHQVVAMKPESQIDDKRRNVEPFRVWASNSTWRTASGHHMLQKRLGKRRGMIIVAQIGDPCGVVVSCNSSETQFEGHCWKMASAKSQS